MENFFYPEKFILFTVVRLDLQYQCGHHAVLEGYVKGA
jgi:hypothetical protein